jgi:FkbM family methyltransferase
MPAEFTDAFRTLSIRGFIEQIGFTGIDIGARGGFDAALLPIAWATEMIGFEPEPEEAAALERVDPRPWKRRRLIPTAIGGSVGARTLYIPPSPESASLLPHNPEMIDWFGVDRQHRIAREIPVETTTLDDLHAQGIIGGIDYLKIDVEGAEGEILRAGSSVLADCLALRVEASFLEQRVGQPLIWEIGALLSARGFLTLDMIALQRWRRDFIAASPYRTQTALPFSKGVAAQADLICVRDFRTLDDPCRIAKLAVLAAAMGYVDHAALILRHHASVIAEVAKDFAVDFTGDLRTISTKMGASASTEAITAQVRGLVPLARSLLGGLPGR